MNLKTEQREKILATLKLRIEKAIANNEDLTWQSFLNKFDGFFNPSTKNTYQGRWNNFVLSFVSAAFDDPRFLGFGQCKLMKGFVKMSEKSVQIYRPLYINDESCPDKKKFVGFKDCYVFNVKQTNLIEKGIIPESVVEDCNKDLTPLSAITDFVKYIDFKQVEIGGTPHYHPVADRIGMPPFKAFHNSWKHGETLLHELIHWTGHPSRLNRLVTGFERTNQDYSKEELVAELGAAFLMGDLGVKPCQEQTENQAAYLRNWLKPLKDNIEMLLEAAEEAIFAVTFLHDCHSQGKQEKEKAKDARVA